MWPRENRLTHELRLRAFGPYVVFERVVTRRTFRAFLRADPSSGTVRLVLREPESVERLRATRLITNPQCARVIDELEGPRSGAFVVADTAGPSAFDLHLQHRHAA